MHKLVARPQWVNILAHGRFNCNLELLIFKDRYLKHFLNQGWLILREHDDVIKWKHSPRYWPFVRGIHRSLVNSPHKGQWRGAMMFSLICAWKKRLSKQSRGWWFQMPSRRLWRHSDDTRAVSQCPSNYPETLSRPLWCHCNEVLGHCHLCGEFTSHRWIPRTKASEAELWCFLWSASE